MAGPAAARMEALSALTMAASTRAALAAELSNVKEALTATAANAAGGGGGGGDGEEWEGRQAWLTSVPAGVFWGEHLLRPRVPKMNGWAR